MTITAPRPAVPAVAPALLDADTFEDALLEGYGWTPEDAAAFFADAGNELRSYSAWETASVKWAARS